MCLFTSRVTQDVSVLQQVYPDLPQGTHSPLRVIALIRIQIPEELLQKRRISILYDCLSYVLHQVELIVYVVHRQEMRPCGLLGRDVVDVGSSNAQPAVFSRPTANTPTAFFDGTKVFRKNGVTDVDNALRCDCIAKSLNETSEWSAICCRSDLQLCALARRSRTCRRRVLLRPLDLQGIPIIVSAWRSTSDLPMIAYHAHHVSRLLLWQQPGAGVYHPAICILGLPTRETSYSDAWCIPSYHLRGTFPPQFKIQAALYDAE
jgi:hypothetical protein